MINVLIAGIGAAFGSGLRFLMMEFGKRYVKVTLPIITLLINLSGAFCLGYLSIVIDDPKLRLFIGTGIIGGFTTFSTFMTELVILGKKHKIVEWVYGFLTIGLGVLAGMLGLYLAMFSK